MVGRVVKENHFLRLDEIGNIIWQFDVVEDYVEKFQRLGSQEQCGDVGGGNRHPSELSKSREKRLAVVPLRELGDDVRRHRCLPWIVENADTFSVAAKPKPLFQSLSAIALLSESVV